MQFFHISVGSFPPVQTAEYVCPVRLCRIVLFNVLSAWGRENNKGIDWTRRARMKEPGWSGLPLGFILIRLIVCYCIQLGWSSAQNVCIKMLPSLFPNREWAGGIMCMWDSRISQIASTLPVTIVTEALCIHCKRSHEDMRSVFVSWIARYCLKYPWMGIFKLSGFIQMTECNICPHKVSWGRWNSIIRRNAKRLNLANWGVCP